MSIRYLKTDLFHSPACALINPVNTEGVMGKGLARVFKMLYYEMFEEYKVLCLQRRLKIGSLFFYRTKDRIIINFPTKKHWRNPSKVEYIEKGLRSLVLTYQEHGVRSIALPAIGCGNGGLGWLTEVKPLVEEYLSDLPIPIYVHLNHPRN